MFRLSSRRLPVSPAVRFAPALLLAACSALAVEQPQTLTERYERDVQRIVAAVQADNDAMPLLQELCDDIGHRLSGSPQLDDAIQWAVRRLRAAGHDFVGTETVMVTQWIRGEESVEMLAPRPMSIPMLGLGGSVGTPAGGITADVLVVNSFEELQQRGSEARGRIVVFNFAMPTENEREGAGYGAAVRYRYGGAGAAAKHGARAALVRSVTTRSLQSPHTGGMGYPDGVEQIPTAAITTEFAEMLARLQSRGQAITLRLNMEARTSPAPVPSANVIAELRGRERPDEIVVISGHLDSWDVGTGAQDDGAGVVTAMAALNALKKLDLRPRRTIRVVLWTNEENGIAGGRTYKQVHADELARHVAAIELDSGAGAPIGYGVEAQDKGKRARAIEQLGEILGLCRAAGNLPAYEGYSGADIRPMLDAGFVLLGQDADMTHYFDIHHTEADTIDKIDPKALTNHVAVMAAVSYVIADMDERIGN